MTDDGGFRKYMYRACHVSIAMSRILGNQPQLSAQHKCMWRARGILCEYLWCQMPTHNQQQQQPPSFFYYFIGPLNIQSVKRRVLKCDESVIYRPAQRSKDKRSERRRKWNREKNHSRMRYSWNALVQYGHFKCETYTHHAFPFLLHSKANDK